MANSGLQLLGFTLGFLGVIGLIACVALPQWKMSSYAGDNIVTAVAMYEGLFMSCAYQSTGQMQCKAFDSLLKLDGTLQGTRALMIIGIVVGFFAILISSVGMKCTTCLADNKTVKGRVAMIGGILFITAGFSAIIATSWYGHNVTREFYDPLIPINSKYEFGSALFIGWAAAGFCILGGAFLAANCKQGSHSGRSYPQPKSSAPGGRDYV
ncbi:claudin-1 [Latimeria chalumnae]|uniref:Claudin 1 n=1 Tax=Latimeria chalumnae TaxID=7897 RepID=H3B6P8_LATCH|nr:PREDICTED: claudin-1 [Latimeria chalumnae]|eukprot:XP_005992524.1 PREDICTED: claudin-1 [Latimeria chalumnae]